MSTRSRSVELCTLGEEISRCQACPRLVEHREAVAETKRRAYRDETYWGRPVAGFGDPEARLVIVGLAPGAHGANRTGRVFTGDRSGDFLYAALHRAGFASRPESVGREDGLTLRGVFITCPVRCVPPENLPRADELATCARWFRAELALLEKARAFLALGAFAWDALHRLAGVTRSKPFGHGSSTELDLGFRVGSRKVPIVASYHVSQQNTQTGRLTTSMFDQALGAAAMAAGLGPAAKLPDKPRKSTKTASGRLSREPR